MAELYIKRLLNIGDGHFSEGEALERGPVLVVLAEPGAGKSYLLAEFGRIWGVKPVRASLFRHQSKPSPGTRLIIDALDEAAKIEASAVDEIIVKAQEVSSRNVIFASRSYEWAEARTRYVRDCFGVDPVIVRLEPFAAAEQRQLFEDYLPGEDYSQFESEVKRFELSPLLGNPQFLRLFAAAYVQSNRQFTSKAQIFNDAVAHLAIDDGAAPSGKPRPATRELISVSSDVMAKLLLAGSAGVATKETLADIDFPYLPALARSDVEAAHVALDTKLFRPATDTDRHEPVHRIVSEYCAARHLVHRIANQRAPFSLKRVLAVIAPNGSVRDELRGLLGWMAAVGSERVQRSAIELDPYAVLANGDPSQLAVSSKRLLLDRLASLAENNPGFRRSDHWRGFSVGGFFSNELASDVSRMLRSTPVSSPLMDLLLELLVNSGGPPTLVGDIGVILRNGSANRYTRMWASRAIIRLAGSASHDDFDVLVNEATAASLTVAADLVSTNGVGTFTDEEIAALFRAFAAFYPPRRSRLSETTHTATFYLRNVVDQLSWARIAHHLDLLTFGLTCTCQKSQYDCQCRPGVSKVVGHLLDRYFCNAQGPTHPDRLWIWLKSLWYDRRTTTKHSPAVRCLAEDTLLRHELHKRAFAGIQDYKKAREIRWRSIDGHAHAGLAFQDGDERLMADFAYSTGNTDVWAVFWSPPRYAAENQGPDPFRRHLREQAAVKPLFSAIWAKLEREHNLAREHQRQLRVKRQRRWQRRDQKQKQSMRSKFAANRDKIDSGQHWGWLRYLAEGYLYNRAQLAELTDDISIAENALRNCVPFLKGHIPSIEQLGQGSDIALVVFASCWLQYWDVGHLAHIDRLALVAARTQTAKYPWMTDEAFNDFEQAIDREIFPTRKCAETFARGYIEPGLLLPRDRHAHNWWLSGKEVFAHLRPTLSIEWLQRFPSMPISARDALFDLAASIGDRQALLDIIRQRVAEATVAPTGETEEAKQDRLDDLRFWQVRRFFFEPTDDDGWGVLSCDRNIVFALDVKAGRFGGGAEGWPRLSAHKIYKVLDAFVEIWTPVPLPSSYGSDDPPEERGFRFLADIVWRIGHDKPERALDVIAGLIEDNRFNHFKQTLRTLHAECSKKLALASFEAPSPDRVVSMLDASGIASVEDLRAFAVEELEHLQAWLRTAETNPLATYYPAGQRVDENTARDRVVDALANKMLAMNMPVTIEHQLADSKRCDFTVSSVIEGRRRLLVVEAKGQWHPEVFSAACTQLRERYSSHKDAEDQGIYLVFWFGREIEVAGRSKHGIATAAELKKRIVAEMPSELRCTIDVFVLDVSPKH